MQRYDYIIAGGGLSGLSLAYHINQTTLRDKSILIIDQDTKTQNDRTWCFWEMGDGFFEPVVRQKWNKVYFHGTDFSALLDIGDYSYKCIQGIDFYNFVKADLSKNPNVSFKQERIERVKDVSNGGFVITDQSQYVADYVFDSTYALKQNLPKQHNLLQHFKGWEIVTTEPVFDVTCPTMMDYRVPQRGLGVRFMYVLPQSSTRAMVEYTVFSDQLLPQEEYEAELKNYIADFLQIKNYTIAHVEFGIIPMTDELTPNRVGDHVMRIGTSGGNVKASTGYAFQRTQRFSSQIVSRLLENKAPFHSSKTIKNHFKNWLDSVLLNVLLKERALGKDVFTALYKNNPTPALFAFLDEDSTVWQDLKIMSTVPLWAFTKAAVDLVFRWLL
jgi:lycopene beta-cyclase